MVFVSDLSHSINMDTNSQASSTSKMQSDNQETAFEKLLREFHSNSKFTLPSESNSQSSSSIFMDLTDFRGSPYSNEHDGVCLGNTCDQCLQCGKYRRQCADCKWVFNRWKCPNTKCVSKTIKPFDISELSILKRPP